MFRADWRAQAPGASGTPDAASSPTLGKIEAVSESATGPSQSSPPPAQSLATSTDVAPIVVSITSKLANQDISSLIVSRDKMKKRIAKAELNLTNSSTEKVCIV